MNTSVLSRIVARVWLCCSLSCSVAEVESAKELSAYITSPDHDLSQQVESNKLTITVTYKPTDLLVAQEIGEEPAEVSVIELLRKKYGAYHYFVLSLAKDNNEALQPSGKGLGQYSALVQTLSFRMNQYVTLTTAAQDTIPVGDFALARTYGMGQSTEVLFVFSKEKTEGKDWVQFNLNEFGLGTGNQRFRFRTKDLEAVPKINFATRKPV